MTYANLHGYSDIHPYEVVRIISDKTIEVRAMNADLNPDWKPEFVPGGFCGRCINQNEQSWIIKSNSSNATVRVRKRKDGKWYSAFGRHILSDEPKYFYDYNF